MEFQTLLSHIRYPPCWGINRCGIPDILKTLGKIAAKAACKKFLGDETCFGFLK